MLKKRIPEYYVWSEMRARCRCKTHKRYSDYGGRGIAVCDEWIKFQTFLKDMGERPKGTSLDRIDNNSGYCKENCRWATKKEQSRNTRQNRWITIGNKRKIMSDWAEECGISLQTISSRIHLMGWDEAKAVITPVNKR